jgi:hypothetical protein
MITRVCLHVFPPSTISTIWPTVIDGKKHVMTSTKSDQQVNLSHNYQKKNPGVKRCMYRSITVEGIITSTTKSGRPFPIARSVLVVWAHAAADEGDF